MRSSIGGWVENRPASSTGPARCRGLERLRQLAGLQAAQARERVDHRPRRAEQLGRAARRRGTRAGARTRRRSSRRGCRARSARRAGDEEARCRRRARCVKIALSTIMPTTRDRKITKVLTTPWIRVSVTMSPLATCADLVAEHRLDLFRAHRLQQAGGDRDQRRVLERAGGEGVRRALEDRRPPACRCRPSRRACAPSRPASTGSCLRSRRSPARRCSILAIDLEISSEMIAPPKPNTAENTSSAV